MSCPSVRDGRRCQLDDPHPGRRHRHEVDNTDDRMYRHTVCFTWNDGEDLP